MARSSGVLRALLLGAGRSSNPWHQRATVEHALATAAAATTVQCSYSTCSAASGASGAARAGGGPSELEARSASGGGARRALSSSSAASQQPDPSPGGATKRLNLCNAINDALHVHLDENPKCAAK